jgi:hypothetical protein
MCVVSASSSVSGAVRTQIILCRTCSDRCTHLATRCCHSNTIHARCPQVSSAPSPPPSAPNVLDVSVVAHNQTQHDWMVEYVRCLIGRVHPSSPGSTSTSFGEACPFLTELQSGLGQQSSWPTGGSVVLTSPASSRAVVIAPPPPPSKPPFPPWPPLLPGESVSLTVDFCLTVYGTNWMADRQTEIHAALANLLHVVEAQAHSVACGSVALWYIVVLWYYDIVVLQGCAVVLRVYTALHLL